MKKFSGIRGIIAVGFFALLTSSAFALPIDKDTSFTPGTGVSGGGASRILLLNNGKILVSGAFSTFNGASRSSTALLEANGTLNPAFSGMSLSLVNDWTQLSNGYVIAGGNFTNYFYRTSTGFLVNMTVNRVVKFNPNDGMPDTGFSVGSGPNAAVFAVADAGGGKIYIVGNFTQYNGVARNRIARLNADGSLDATFDPGTGAGDLIYDIAVASDGKVYIGGDFTDYAGAPVQGLIRLNADGTRDTTFAVSSPYGGITRILVQPDGKILATSHYAGGGIYSPSRFLPNGSLDATFNTFSNLSWKGTSNIKAMLIQPDGKIVIGGSFYGYNGSGSQNIARILPNGLLDTGFNPNNIKGLDKDVYDLALQPDGKILAVGIFSFTIDGEDNYPGIARFVGGGAPVDTTAPVVALSGNASMSLTVGGTFSDPGATWIDAVDGNGTIVSASSGTINTTVAGTYMLSYWKTDAAGNRSNIVTRTVTVNPVAATGSTTPPASTGSTTPPVSTGSTIPPVSTGTTLPGVFLPLPTQTNIVTLSANSIGQKTYTVNNRVTTIVCPTVVQPYAEAQVLATDIMASPFVNDIKAMIMFRALEQDGQSAAYKVSGVANNNSEYSPSRQVTRAEFVKMLTRSLGCQYAYTGTTSGFPDVNSSDWSAEYITFAVKKGWINGYANGTFGPNNPITRAEAAKILARSIALPATASTSSFTDVPTASTFIPYIQALSEARIMNGASATTFNPNANISRGEVARIFYKTFLGGAR